MPRLSSTKPCGAAKWNDDARRAVVAFRDRLAQYEKPFEADAIKHLLSDTLADAGIKQGKVMQAMRLALTGLGTGPDLMLTMEIVGKQGVLERLDTAMTTLQ